MYFVKICEDCLNYGSPCLRRNLYLLTCIIVYEMKYVMSVVGTEVECRKTIAKHMEYFINIYLLVMVYV
jgi:hypothetical protein